jgi:hypothetical protein
MENSLWISGLAEDLGGDKVSARRRAAELAPESSSVCDQFIIGQ